MIGLTMILTSFGMASALIPVLDKLDDLLNDSKTLIYPGIDKLSYWDSKRPWEAYASGCLVLMARPSIDVTSYPITELCEFAVYDNTVELISKCRYIFKHPEFLNKLRLDAVAKALKYFSPQPIALYFLWHVAQKLGLNRSDVDDFYHS